MSSGLLRIPLRLVCAVFSSTSTKCVTAVHGPREHRTCCYRAKGLTIKMHISVQSVEDVHV